MKYGLYSALIAAGLSYGVQAQSTTSNSTETNVATSAPQAPSENLSFSPSVSAGVRTFSKGGITSGNTEGTFGPYVTPSAALNFKKDKLSLTLAYELEVTGGEGFGSNKASIADTTYFKHNPVLAVSGGVSPNWKLNGVIDAKWSYYNGDQAENNSDIFINPDIEYALTPSTSLSAGYVLHQIENFDSTLTREASSGLKAAVDPIAVGKSPRTTLHAGIVTNKIKLAEGTKLTTYVRAGKKIANAADSTSYAYRFQTHLDFTAPVKSITGALRYRFNIEDLKNSNTVKYYNLARVELNYALNTNWALKLANEFTALQSNQAGVKAAYENENYVGAAFSF